MGKPKAAPVGKPARGISASRLAELRKTEALVAERLKEARKNEKERAQRQAQLPKDLGKILSRYD